ncbi:Glycosyltransferase AglI [uncultured archaeon]|nr:Glycosyltransferase AglI [uncultured archaeon]
MINVTLSLNEIGLAVSILILAFIVITTQLDNRKKLTPARKHFVSFIIPTYNDAISLEGSIQSIFDSYDKNYFEILVVNDCSTDNTKKIIEKIKQKLPIKLINNKTNLGKSVSVNNAFKLTKGEIIWIVDSDTHLTKTAVNDCLARLEDPKVGGVSCRYTPLNKGVLASMQKVEYGMISLMQRSTNFPSVMGFWGGCLAVKREVFIKVGLLSVNCMAEDGDLALKIGKNGWETKESFVPVASQVPDTLMGLCKQRIRWTAGQIQNLLNHFSYLVTNPFTVFYALMYCLLIVSFSLAIIPNLSESNLSSMLGTVRNIEYGFIAAVGIAKLDYVVQLVENFWTYALYPLLSLPYVAVNYSIKKKPYKFLLVFPYAIIYLPMLAITSIIGGGIGLYKTIKLDRNQRAW